MRELIEDLMAGAGEQTAAEKATRITPMIIGAQFEIRIDHTPRSYRDRKDFAMEAASFLKSRNPLSDVEVRDRKSGEVTAVTYKAG
jgi:hypothetical protein